ncbi:MAG: VOC family protein, partial [Candidatus Dormibacteraceae bacterium]
DPLASPIGIYVIVEDPDAHYRQAKTAGAEIVQELTDQEYGSREYSTRDLEGNLWSFGTYDPYVNK